MSKECEVCGETYDTDANDSCPYCGEENEEGLDGDDDGSGTDFRSL